jgi:hypothetical protein
MSNKAKFSHSDYKCKKNRNQCKEEFEPSRMVLYLLVKKLFGIYAQDIEDTKIPKESEDLYQPKMRRLDQLQAIHGRIHYQESIVKIG